MVKTLAWISSLRPKGALALMTMAAGSDEQPEQDRDDEVDGENGHLYTS
jgi:hypothetical protein